MTNQNTDPIASLVEEELEANRKARAELLAALDAVPPERRLERWFGTEQWSLHDIIAHVYSWQDGFAHALEQIARGERPEVPGYDPRSETGTDDYNARVTLENRHLTWEDLLAHLRAARERHEAAVKNLVGKVTPERYEPEKSARRLSSSARHDREHLPEILAWREREGI